MKLTLEAAKMLIHAAQQKAREMGISADIAIVDDGGNLIAFERMDGARIAGIVISQDKAWTAAAFKMPTANMATAAQPGGPMFGINTTNHGRVVILAGGIPLTYAGYVVGAIGVSGGTSTQDAEIASAAVMLFEGYPHVQARIGSYA